MKHTTLSLLVLVIATNSLFAQGWTRKKKEGYFNLSQTFLQSFRFYSPAGTDIKIRTTGLYVTSIYGEYGLSSRWTAIASVPFLVQNDFNRIQYRQSGRVIAADRLRSIGDIELALKLGFFQKGPIVVATTLVLGLPTGNPSGGSSKILQTGDGEFNQILRVDGSHSFYPKPFYTSAYVAYNNRTSGFSDEFRYGFDFGYTGRHFNAIFHLNSILSTRNGASNGLESVSNAIFSNNMEVILPSIEFAYNLSKNYGLNAAIGYPIAGKSVLGGASFKVGIYAQVGKH